MGTYPSSRCQECPLFTRLSYYVPAKKVEGAKIALVGEAPGYWETVHKEPFVGPAGKIFSQSLEKVGLKRSEVTITNVLKCNPKDNKLPANLDLAIECCSEILQEDIKGVEVVVGMGNVPLGAMVGLYGGISNRRGSVYPLGDGRPYIATLHPSFLLRSLFVSPKEGAKLLPREVLDADIAKAIRIVKGEEWRVEENYIIEPTQVDLDTFLERLYKPERRVTIDIEAPRVSPQIAVPLIAAFYIDGLGICVEFEENIEFFADALVSPTPKNFQNGIYDVFVFQNVGLRVENWASDTLFKHHLLYAELPHNLGFIQSIHTWMPYHKDMRHALDIEWDK